MVYDFSFNLCTFVQQNLTNNFYETDYTCYRWYGVYRLTYDR